MGSPLTQTWRDWLRLNRDRGCDPTVLFQKALSQGFDADAIALELGAPELLRQAPLLDPHNRPRAWRLDTEMAQIYEIPALLTADECTAVISAIDQALVPSTVTRGSADYRTRRTCHLTAVDPLLTQRLDQRSAALIGVDPALSEPLQGQRYDPGQYFKAHTDWFAPGTDEFELHTRIGGQRTWTLMVYLNRVEAAGETVFERVGRSFTPAAGYGLAWNNLQRDGRPNPATLHEAMPVLSGRKYVITKWFRQNPGRCR